MNKSSLFCLAFVLFSSTLMITSCKRVRGDGHLEKESRNVSGFKGVRSHGSMDIYLTTGANYSVEIEADGNLLEYIETEIKGDDLDIGTRDNVSLRPRNHMKVYITAPSFDKLTVSGSGNIYTKNKIQTESLALRVSGSGNIQTEVDAASVDTDISGSGAIEVKGNAKKLHSEIAGSGELSAKNLVTEEAELRVAGSGNARVNVSKELKVSIAGSGDVQYTGDAHVSSNIAGSGSVNRKN